jgi:hypothetical protein
MPFRVRIILLSMGALFGISSGIAHLSHGHGFRHGREPCYEYDRGPGGPPSGHWRWEPDSESRSR